MKSQLFNSKMFNLQIQDQISNKILKRQVVYKSHSSLKTKNVGEWQNQCYFRDNHKTIHQNVEFGSFLQLFITFPNMKKKYHE